MTRTRSLGICSRSWGSLPLREIKRPQIHEVLDTIAGKGLTIGVNRVQAVISRLFTVALDRSLIDAHPAARLIKRFTETDARSGAER